MGGSALKNDYEIRGDVTAIFLRRKNGEILETIISTSDLEKADEFESSWHAWWNTNTKSFYAKGTSANRKTVYLHRHLLGNPKGLVVDHKDHQTLNNTRENIRAVTKGQNSQNYKGAYSNNKSSGILGVSWNSEHGKWKVQIQVNGKNIFLGHFTDIKEAEKTALFARKKYKPYQWGVDSEVSY